MRYPPAIKSYDGPLKNLKSEFGIKSDEKVIGVIGALSLTVATTLF